MTEEKPRDNAPPPVRRVGSLIVVDGQAIPYERILNVVPADEGAGTEIFIKGERENQVNYIPVAMPFEAVVAAIGRLGPTKDRERENGRIKAWISFYNNGDSADSDLFGSDEEFEHEGFLQVFAVFPKRGSGVSF